MAIVPRGTIPGKVCPICQEWLPLNHFKRNGKSSDGHDHKCRLCRGYRQIMHSCHDGIEGKICARCNEWKPLSDFGRDRQKSDGLYTYCKSCNAEKSRNAYAANADAWNARERRRYQANREQRLAQVRRYRLANLERIREYDRRRSPSRYRRFWQLRLVYTTRRRTREAQAEGKHTSAEWRELCARYDYTCLCCGRREPDIKLSKDHIVPLVMGGRNSIDNLQPLCLQCNKSKGTREIDYRGDRHNG